MNWLSRLFGSRKTDRCDPIATKPQKNRVGAPFTLQANSPHKKLAAVFEDDGETGYFYAVQLKDGRFHIQEAMLIYDVANVADKSEISEFLIAWTAKSDRAALFINSHPHAVFDFSNLRGYCRLNFPTPGLWGTTFAWNDDALLPFRPSES